LPPRQVAQKIITLGSQILIGQDGFMSFKGLRIQSYVDYLIDDRIVLVEVEQGKYA